MNKKDEFFTLIPRKGEAKLKEKKSKKPRFKKGSWKHWLWKKLKNWKSGRLVEDFHFTKLENLVVYRQDKPKVIISKKRFDLKTLKDLQRKHDDLYVLINATERMYMRISLKSYLRLMEIDKIAINFKLRGSYDEDVEVMDVFESDWVIDNINDLANFINFHRKAIEGVYEIQAMCCAFTDYEFKFKILVYKQDGSVKTYKSDMNDFMEDYGLYQF